MKHLAYGTLMQQHGSHSRQLREAQSLERMAHHVSQLITLCEELTSRHQNMPDAAEFWDDEARALSWDLASIRASLR